MNNTQQTDKPSFFYRFAKALVGWLAYGLFGLKVIGDKDNIPDEGACIAAGNHIHLVDPVFSAFAQRRQIHYMAKAELFRIPVIGSFCRWYGAFPVNRGAHDIHAINAAMRVLKDGQVLGIFPEGTRSKDGELGEGKPGVILLAHRAGVPIYPFAVYAKHKPLIPFCRYTVAFGKPVTTGELGVTKGSSREFREAAVRLMEIISDLRDQCKEARR